MSKQLKTNSRISDNLFFYLFVTNQWEEALKLLKSNKNSIINNQVLVLLLKANFSLYNCRGSF